MIAQPKVQGGRVHDFLQTERRSALQAMLAPKRVALVGATDRPGSVGAALLQNLKGQEKFRLFPVNPKRSQVGGLESYRRIGEIEERIDLAVIATPAPTVPGIIEECVRAKVVGAVIISAGFRECGLVGAKLEEDIAKAARGKMRIIGPNCLGVMSPCRGLNATFAGEMALKGNVGFISQSGALCTAILDWSLGEQVGFSAFISLGSMLDVSWGDLIFHLGDDPQTKSIVIYMESVGNARSFLSAAREVALTKPIIVLKVGRTEQAARAVISHTGSLTGSDEVLDAAFRRVGVLRVKTIEELFDMAEALAKQPRPKGRRLAIITNAGGPGVVATDMAVAEEGELAQLSEQSIARLNQLLPAHWSHGNPVDVLGDAKPERYAQVLEIIRQDPNTDGALVILTPQAMSDPTATAEQVSAFARFDGKPLLACWMGGQVVQPGRSLLNAAGICTFDYPDIAARAFQYMWRYTDNLRALYETPALGPLSERHESARAGARRRLAEFSGSLTLVPESAAKSILRSYGIDAVETHVGMNENQAVAIAQRLGYPVVLKVHSLSITHKSQVGGVALNLQNAAQVRRAWEEMRSRIRKQVGPEHFLGVSVQPYVQHAGYELILGSSVDPQFGPVLLFGVGGRLVEVFHDHALALPPLNSTLARRMMERTSIYRALKGEGGAKAVDLVRLEQALVAFSQLVTENPGIREIEINPLLVSAKGALALDARIVLHRPERPGESWPRPAIRPYPAQYSHAWKTKRGQRFLIRPIRPEDEPLLVEFHRTLSEQSVYYRYFSPLQLSLRIAHERLTRMCFNDYDREIALVAQVKEKGRAEGPIVGVGRLSKMHAANEAEFALVVSDPWQGQGLGTQLLKLLLRVGREEKLERIFAHILGDNRVMRGLCQKLGFQLSPSADESEVVAQIKL